MYRKCSLYRFPFVSVPFRAATPHRASGTRATSMSFDTTKSLPPDHYAAVMPRKYDSCESIKKLFHGVVQATGMSFYGRIINDIAFSSLPAPLLGKIYHEGYIPIINRLGEHVDQYTDRVRKIYGEDRGSFSFLPKHRAIAARDEHALREARKFRAAAAVLIGKLEPCAVSIVRNSGYNVDIDSIFTFCAIRARCRRGRRGRGGRGRGPRSKANRDFVNAEVANFHECGFLECDTKASDSFFGSLKISEDSESPIDLSFLDLPFELTMPADINDAFLRACISERDTDEAYINDLFSSVPEASELK